MTTLETLLLSQIDIAKASIEKCKNHIEENKKYLIAHEAEIKEWKRYLTELEEAIKKL